MGPPSLLEIIRCEASLMNNQPHEEFATCRCFGFPDCRSTGEASVGGKEQAIGAAGTELAVLGVPPNKPVFGRCHEVNRRSEIPKVQVLVNCLGRNTAPDVSDPAIADKSFSYRNPRNPDVAGEDRKGLHDRVMAGQPPIRPEFSTLAIAELHKRGRVHQRGGILVLWYGNQTPRARRCRPS
jgi:hypothetical protein